MKWLFLLKRGKKPWSSSDFEELWDSLQLLGDLSDSAEEDVLEVIAFSGAETEWVLEVRGNSNIAKYCQIETLAVVQHDWKKRNRIAKHSFIHELPAAVVSVKEECVLQSDSEPSLWTHSPKDYVLTKRFVYQNDLYKCILALARNSSEQFLYMDDSVISNVPIQYEVWIESKVYEIDALPAVVRAIDTLIPCERDGLYLAPKQALLLTEEQKEEVRDGYFRLVKSKMINYKNDKKPFYSFVPKPVTLEKAHILTPNASCSSISIQSRYAVTEKADGERYILFVHTDGCAYLINSQLDIRGTSVQAKSPETLIDGELITSNKRKDGINKNLFVAFDLYFVDGQSVMELPLIHETKPSRYSKLLELIDAQLGDACADDLDIIAKRHYASDGHNMFETCRYLLENTDQYLYDHDGLVFTPRDLPVFGYYPNNEVSISIGVCWNRLLKWKPTGGSTIDFLVQTNGRAFAHPVTKQKYVVAQLYTGYKASQWEPINVMEGLRRYYDYEYNNRRYRSDEYKAKLFQPSIYYEPGVEEAHVFLTDGQPKAEDGGIIMDKTIVEFAYNPDPSVQASKRWKALRIREDKTNLFQRTGSISKTANDLSAAMSIWRSIHCPVTTTMITGAANASTYAAPEELGEKLLGANDSYYTGRIPRHHRLSLPMLNFHNHGIKKQLYQLSPGRKALLELACGMGSDLPRWRDAAYRFVLAVDLVRDNIANPKEGAYARLQRMKHSVSTFERGVEITIRPDTVFVMGDCTLPLHNGNASEGIDQESKEILRLVYRRDVPTRQPYLRKVTGRAADGFDVVSCMFGIQYFFQTREKLNGFLSNVSLNLNRNGILIGTFMDADKVHALLESTSQGVAEGKMLEDQYTVWSIVRRYNDYDPVKKETFGKRIDVYLEKTNRFIPEFLVHFDTLVKQASAHGLKLQDTSYFSQTFSDLRSKMRIGSEGQQSVNNYILELDKSEVLKQFSFLNRWVVFKKI